MTQLNITSPNEAAIDQVVKESGLVLTEATEIKGAYLPFLSQLQEVVEQAGKINADNPTDIDEKIARELRLKSVKIRTGSEKLKDERKKIYLVKGNLEQASYNVIKNSCLLAEAALEEVEKAREKKEAARKEALRIERLDMLKPYCDNPEFYPLGEMDEPGFNDLLNGMKLQAEAKVKAEQDRLEALRLEEERKEKEAKIHAITQQRTVFLATTYQYSFTGETPLGELSDSDYDMVVFQAKNAFEAKQKEEQRIKEENEKLRKQKEADDAKAAKAKKEADDKLKKEREEAAEKLRIEKEKSDKLAADLKAKQDKEDEDKRLADEAEKKRIADEKKAAKAPDKEKLQKWVNQFDIADIPTGLSNESGTIGLEISNKFDAFKEWAKKQIELL